MFGLWKIKKLYDEDSAGAARIADVVSCMNEAIEGSLYLPPYLRQNQCGIDVDAVVVGYLDDVTGKGAAFCGLDDADYGYFLDADIEIKKTLKVCQKATFDDEIEAAGDITSTSGDVKAGTVSLKNHVHQATLSVSTTGSATSQTGTATGSTNAPTP